MDDSTKDLTSSERVESPIPSLFRAYSEPSLFEPSRAEPSRAEPSRGHDGASAAGAALPAIAA